MFCTHQMGVSKIVMDFPIFTFFCIKIGKSNQTFFLYTIIKLANLSLYAYYEHSYVVNTIDNSINITDNTFIAF